MISSGTCPVCGLDMFGGVMAVTPDDEEIRVCQMCHDHRFNYEEVSDQPGSDEPSGRSNPD